jgi:hypothetical protein
MVRVTHCVGQIHESVNGDACVVCCKRVAICATGMERTPQTTSINAAPRAQKERPCASFDSAIGKADNIVFQIGHLPRLYIPPHVWQLGCPTPCFVRQGRGALQQHRGTWLSQKASLLRHRRKCIFIYILRKSMASQALISTKHATALRHYVVFFCMEFQPGQSRRTESWATNIVEPPCKAPAKFPHDNPDIRWQTHVPFTQGVVFFI